MKEYIDEMVSWSTSPVNQDMADLMREACELGPKIECVVMVRRNKTEEKQKTQG